MIFALTSLILRYCWAHTWPWGWGMVATVAATGYQYSYELGPAGVDFYSSVWHCRQVVPMFQITPPYPRWGATAAASG